MVLFSEPCFYNRVVEFATSLPVGIMLRAFYLLVSGNKKSLKFLCPKDRPQPKASEMAVGINVNTGICDSPFSCRPYPYNTAPAGSGLYSRRTFPTSIAEERCHMEEASLKVTLSS